MESLSTRLRNDLNLVDASPARSTRVPALPTKRTETGYDAYFRQQDTRSKDRSARRRRSQRPSTLAADHKSDHGNVDPSDDSDSDSDDSSVSAKDHMPMPYGDYPGAATPVEFTPSSYFSTGGERNPFAPSTNSEGYGHSTEVDGVPRTRSSYFSDDRSTGGSRSFHFSTGGNGGGGFNFSNAEDIFEEFLRTSDKESDRHADALGYASANHALRSAHSGPDVRSVSPEPEGDREDAPDFEVGPFAGDPDCELRRMTV